MGKMSELDGNGPDINVTDIGDYVDKNCCERDLKLRLISRKDPDALNRMFPYRQTIRGTLDPVLSMSGRNREAEVEAALSQRMRCLNPSIEGEENNMRWSGLLSALRTLSKGEECFAREVKSMRDRQVSDHGQDGLRHTDVEGAEPVLASSNARPAGRRRPITASNWPPIA